MKIIPVVCILFALGFHAPAHSADTIRTVDQSAPAASIRSGQPPEGPLDLAQAIGIALENNPNIATAAWEVDAAKARRDHAFGARLPRLSVEGGFVHHLDEQRLLPVRQPGDPAILSRDIVSGDLVLTLPLFTGGRLVNQVKAAELLEQAARHDLARNREELVYNVSVVFYGILAQRHVIESLEFSQKTLDEHLKRVDALIAAQKAARVDRLRTEVRMADVRQRLVRERNVMAVRHRALAALLGYWNYDAELSIRGDLTLESKQSVPDLETAWATARAGRNDYLAARSALEAHARNVDASEAGKLPAVSLQGVYGNRWAAGQTIGAGREVDDIGRVGVIVDIPILEGGQANARIREQRATHAAAREHLRKLELSIRLEIETALLDVRSSGERIDAVQKSIDQARESLRIEQEKYGLEKGAIVDVLDAQAALLETQTVYYRTLTDLHTALAQLRLAMGGAK